MVISRRRMAGVVAVVLVAQLLLGCTLLSDMFGLETDDNIADKQAAKDLKKSVKQVRELRQGIDRDEGNYKLTFGGAEVPAPLGSFEPLNRTPGMLTNSAFTAREENTFSSGDPRVAIQVKDTWVIDATRSGDKITGTAAFTRWRDESHLSIIKDEETGAERVSDEYFYPSVTVKWDGELKAIVDSGGIIAGVVEGTFSNNEGFTKPFKWEFTGDPLK